MLKKDVSVHEIEHFLALISVKEIEEEAESKSTKHKREFENLQAWCELLIFICFYVSHLHGILDLKKVVEKDKNKKNLTSHMYDDFCAHLVVMNLKTQESKING